MALIYVAMFLSTSVVKQDGDRLMSTQKQQGITALQAPKRDCVLTSKTDGNKDCTRACEGQTRHPVPPHVLGVYIYAFSNHIE